MVRTPDRVEVRIVGLATFGGADSQGSATYAGFTTEFADEVLLPEPGKASSLANTLSLEGFGAFAVPELWLAVVLALGALVGVLAAVFPAHRAARMDVLSAIAME